MKDILYVLLISISAVIGWEIGRVLMEPRTNESTLVEYSDGSSIAIHGNHQALQLETEYRDRGRVVETIVNGPTFELMILRMEKRPNKPKPVTPFAPMASL